jgi:hypothetical protein
MALHSSAFDVALQHSMLALEFAEKAFFDDKMVSMLYFPDEHKYAIYTPLFGPLALPLLMALLKELQAVFQGWRSSRVKHGGGKEKEVLVVKEGDKEETVLMREMREPIQEGPGN